MPDEPSSAPAVASRAQAAELAAAREGKFLEGSGGRLFLAKDSNAVLDQLVGDRLLKERHVDAWGRVLAERERTVRELAGARYVVLVPPNAHYVYPDQLPEGFEIAARRPLTQVMERAAVDAPDVPIIHPLEALRGARGIRDPYPTTDTHWNDFGAWVAYDEVMSTLAEMVDVRRVTFDMLHLWEDVERGDLGSKHPGSEPAPLTRAWIEGRAASLTFDNLVRNTGRRVEYSCEEAPATTCLVFGDSFSLVMLKYFAESFRTLVFAHLPLSVDLALVEEVRPDVVLTILNDRFLIRVPRDGDALSLEQEAERKRADGMIWPESAARRAFSVLVEPALDAGPPPSLKSDG